jgi:2-oxoglutarate ferredoxin oxidoreductase subunit alpha
VIFDIQRVGPSTGMPTRTQQCDLMLAAYASHGDTRHVLLFPNSPEECFYMSVEAFDLAERLQTPVFVMSDLDIGMNDWMCPALKWDDNYRPDRGKVLTKEQIEGLEKFHRYLDKDGDGIPYRTLPGVHPKGAYFTRGSGHTQYGAYTEDSTEYQIVLDRLVRKFNTAKTLVPKALFTGRNSHDVGIVSMGSCDGAVQEALDILKRRGIQLDYMRVRAEPRRAAAEPAHAGDRRRESEAALDPALQRPADVLQRHRRRRGRRAGRGQAARQRFLKANP